MISFLSGSGLEKMELERLHIVDAIKGYRSKSVRYRAAGVVALKEEMYLKLETPKPKHFSPPSDNL